MKYGQIAKASNINDDIYRCFDLIPEKEARKFVKNFSEQPHDQPQVMHTFRELIMGAYLGSRGFAVQSEPDISGKTTVDPIV